MYRIAFAAALLAAAALAGCSSPTPTAPAHPVAPRIAEPAGPCAKYSNDPTMLERCRLYTGADAWRFIPLAGRSADLDTQLRCAPLRRNSGPYERCIAGAPQVIARAPAAASPTLPGVGTPQPSPRPDPAPSAGPEPAEQQPPATVASPEAQAVGPNNLETSAPKQVQRRAAPRDTLADLQARKAEGERRMYEIVHDLLDAFLAEPRGNCSSASLEAAAASAVYVGIASDDLSLRQQGAGWVLDVADGAADHGCPDFARKLYRHVIEVYIGLGYTAHRQRAEIGLADLRGSS